MSRLLVALAFLTAVCSSADAQRDASAIPLSPAVTRSAERFSRIVGLRELPDSRVLVSDGTERRLHLLAADLQTGGDVGREGAGPSEFRSPGALLAYGDSTVLVDVGNSRVHVLDAGATFVRALSLASDAGGFTFSPTVRFVDAAGALYYQGPRGAIGTRAPGAVIDSAPIVRVRGGAFAPDTVAWVRVPVTPTVATRGSGSTQMARALPDPFAWRDDWVVGPNADIAVVRGDGYRVDWYRAGTRRARGPVVNTPMVPVTDDDRRRIAERAGATGAPVGFGSESRPPASAPGTLRAPSAVRSSQKPPFVANATLLDPSGRVWVRRSAHSDATTVLYDLFGPDGAHLTSVRMSVAARVIGFGRNVLYVATADVDDLSQISRHPLP